MLKKLEKALTMGRVFCYNIRMDSVINGLVGRSVVDGSEVLYYLNSKEMQLAMDKNPDSMNDSWDLMCKSLVGRGLVDPRGKVFIDYIVVNGLAKVFH